MIWVDSHFVPAGSWNLPAEMMHPCKFAMTSDQAQYILDNTGYNGYGVPPVGVQALQPQVGQPRFDARIFGVRGAVRRGVAYSNLAHRGMMQFPGYQGASPELSAAAQGFDQRMFGAADPTRRGPRFGVGGGRGFGAPFGASGSWDWYTGMVTLPR